MGILPFRKLLEARRGADWVPPVVLLCLDPGETTGFAVFEDGHLATSGQMVGNEESSIYNQLSNLFITIKPNRVLIEDYRIYADKANTHTWNPLITVRVIGGVEMLCAMMDIRIHYQMASTAKGFCDNTKLQAWNMYSKGNRHATDAIRHGCYFLLFNKELK